MPAPLLLNEGRQSGLHMSHYAVVIVSSIILGIIVAHVPIFSKGLRTTPFILVTTVTALLGDYIAGILAIVLGSIAVDYVSAPIGFKFDAMTFFKVLEYLIIALIIYLITWRSRYLYARNLDLQAMTQELQSVTSALKTEAKGNKKQMKKLNAVNADLLTLINQFIEDDEYWARKWKVPNVQLKPKK